MDDCLVFKTGVEIKIKAGKDYPVIGKIVYLCHPVKSQKALLFDFLIFS